MQRKPPFSPAAMSYFVAHWQLLCWMSGDPWLYRGTELSSSFSYVLKRIVPTSLWSPCPRKTSQSSSCRTDPWCADVSTFEELPSMIRRQSCTVCVLEESRLKKDYLNSSLIETAILEVIITQKRLWTKDIRTIKFESSHNFFSACPYSDDQKYKDRIFPLSSGTQFCDWWALVLDLSASSPSRLECRWMIRCAQQLLHVNLWFSTSFTRQPYIAFLWKIRR